MRKSIRTIVAMGIMLVCAYLIGTTQAETREVKADNTATGKVVEVTPNGYIPLDECIPLEDIACYFTDNDGCLCFELKDIGNQLDSPDNKRYADIIEGLEDTTDEYRNSFVDMRQVVDFVVDDDSLELYLNDGNCYCWKR